MTYRHFDLAEVERHIRDAAERGLMQAMQSAKTDAARHGYELQLQMFEAQTAMQLQVFAMVNQGESADMIAQMVGICISNLICVAISVSDQRHHTASVIGGVISDAFETLAGNGDGSINLAEAKITPTQGGRA